MKDKKNASSVKKFLLATGFPFEMSAAKKFRENGYDVKIGSYFLDLEENKMREMDIVAVKKIGEIKVVIVVECKQSDRDAWIFVAPENKPSLFWNYAKYIPIFQNFENVKKCFSHLHIFDRKLVMANNFITFNGAKQSDPRAINESVKKTIKGTISEMADYELEYGEKNAVFYSAVFFSGKMFSATYNKYLRVKAEKHILLKDFFSSPVYEETNEEIKHLSGYSMALDSWEEQRKKEKVKLKQKYYSRFEPDFIIDIVNGSYINEYIEIIEKEIKKIPIKCWKEKKEKDDNSTIY